MLLVVLFAAGLVVALGVGAFVDGGRARLLLIAGGAAVWAAYAIYVEELASCPARGECEKGLGIIFAGSIVAGWIAGTAGSWALRRLSK